MLFLKLPTSRGRTVTLWALNMALYDNDSGGTRIVSNGLEIMTSIPRDELEAALVSKKIPLLNLVPKNWGKPAEEEDGLGLQPVNPDHTASSADPNYTPPPNPNANEVPAPAP